MKTLLTLRKINLHVGLPMFMAVVLAFQGPISHAYAETTSQAVQQWLDLRDDRQVYDFISYARFINAHPAWPQINSAIRLNAETALLRDGTDSGTLVDWFDQHPPLTDEGRVRLIQALQNSGNTLAAKQQAVEFWHAGYFDGPRAARVFSLIGGFSAADQAARANTLLWLGNLSRIESLLPSLDNTARAIAKARMALQRTSTQAPSLVQDVPGSRRNDDGLLYDRIRYARHRGDDDYAAQLMQNATGQHGAYGHLWGREAFTISPSRL